MVSNLFVSVITTSVEPVSWLIDKPVTEYSLDFLNFTDSTSFFSANEMQRKCYFHLLEVSYKIYGLAPFYSLVHNYLRSVTGLECNYSRS